MSVKHSAFGCTGLGAVPPIGGVVLQAHGGGDAANPRAAGTVAAAALARVGASVRLTGYRGAGHARDRPAFATGGSAGGGMASRRPDMAEPWPALTAMAAAQVAGFVAKALVP